MIEQLCRVGKAVGQGDAHVAPVNGDGHKADGLRAAKTAVLEHAQDVFALVGQATAEHRLRHAAGGAEDLGRAAAHAERQVGRLLFEHLEADAGFLDHLDDLLRGQHKVDVRYAVAAEFLASGLHFLGCAGHDGDMEGRAAVGGVLFAVLVL